MKRCYLVLLVLLAVGVSAQAAIVPVPNGSFEEILKPGDPAVTGTLGGNWTNGVGMTPGASAPMNGSQTATFSDGTTGTSVVIPGWINSGAPWDVPPYDWTEGSGSIAAQNPAPDGINYFTANGGGWGNAPGGAAESDADLTTVVADLNYTISMLVNGPVTPVVLELLADGVVVAPSSTVDPGVYAWSLVSKTYDAASLTPGQALRIRVGWGPDTGGSQSALDMVTMTAVPEPATMLLLGLGGLLLRRKR